MLMAIGLAVSLLAAGLMVAHAAVDQESIVRGWQYWLVSRLLLGGAVFVLLSGLLMGCASVERVECSPLKCEVRF